MDTEEADLLAVMLDGLHTERGGNVHLAGAKLTDEHYVVGAIDELAAVQLDTSKTAGAKRFELIHFLCLRARSMTTSAAMAGSWP